MTSELELNFKHNCKIQPGQLVRFQESHRMHHTCSVKLQDKGMSAYSIDESGLILMFLRWFPIVCSNSDEGVVACYECLLGEKKGYYISEYWSRRYEKWLYGNCKVDLVSQAELKRTWK